MATEKTPAHKRITRAEKSAAEWKQKASLRREENERIKDQIKYTKTTLNEVKDELDTLREEKQELSKLLEKANTTIADLQEECAAHKKKPY